MNIFVVDSSPKLSAQQLPDKHIVKMPLESCQMISIIYSSWYHNWGTIPKIDGTPYNTVKGAFRNHPCTVWASESNENLSWLIAHGIYLCEEYTHRYNKQHSCEFTLNKAAELFVKMTNINPFEIWNKTQNFVRAMPDSLKYDKSINTVIAYRKYVASKPWVKDNYLRDPSRKPSWV